MDAAELAAVYAMGAASPVEVLHACLARRAAVDPLLNALVTLDERGAHEAAERSAARWRAGRPIGPLDGVPITVKDNLFVAGLRATWGSRLYADHVASRDDIAVARLRAAGAVILGKTNTPELALASFTDNLLFGSTGNPWAPDRQPGGSSGGAVTAVASGIGAVALATDAGGSLRRPAGHAGVVTLKPSMGRVPRRHGFPPLVHDFQVIGPIARSVQDLRSMFSVIADPAPSPLPSRGTSRRLRAVLACGPAPIDPEVRSTFRESLDALREIGFAVEETTAAWDPDEVGSLFSTLAVVGVARVVTAFPDWERAVTPAIAAQAEAGLALPATAYVRALDRVSELRGEIAEWVAEVDAVATPSAAALPWPRSEPFPSTIDGRPAGPRAAAIYSTVVNLAGLPAVVVPSRPSAAGLPTGLQLISAPFGDEALLDLAEALERLNPWRRVAPVIG